MGEGSERRAFLGRWGIDAYAGSEYNLSARQIVMGLQCKVVKYLNGGKPGHDETELLQELYLMAVDSGLDGVQIGDTTRFSSGALAVPVAPSTRWAGSLPWTKAIHRSEIR